MPLAKSTAVLWAALITSLAGCSRDVSFRSDVYPIFEKHCLLCHHRGGEGQKASGFNAESYEGILTGTRFGPVIIPGSSVSSTLMALLEQRADPSINMPHGREPLPQEEIETLRKWIDQGAQNN